MRSNWSPADARHADDFVPGLKSKKPHKRLLRDCTPDDVDARLHQQANGGCTTSGQFFPRKLESTPVAVSLRDEEVMAPALSLTFPPEAKLMRPCYGIDAILSDANPSACQQRNQAVILGPSKRAL